MLESLSSTFRKFGVLFPFTASVLSASFPPTPQGLAVLNSTNYPGVSISYKEVREDSTQIFLYRCTDKEQDPNMRDNPRDKVIQRIHPSSSCPC